MKESSGIPGTSSLTASGVRDGEAAGSSSRLPAKFMLLREWRDWADLAFSTIPAGVACALELLGGHYTASVGFGCATVLGAVAFAQSRAINGWRDLYKCADAHNDTLMAALIKAWARADTSDRQRNPGRPA